MTDTTTRRRSPGPKRCGAGPHSESARRSRHGIGLPPKSDDARNCVPLWLLDNHNGTQNAKPATRSQLQPLVLPQDGQAWHEPARCICTPHCMQYGASTLVVGRLMAGD